MNDGDTVSQHISRRRRCPAGEGRCGLPVPAGADLNLSLQALEGERGARRCKVKAGGGRGQPGRWNRPAGGQPENLIIKTADTVRQEMDRRWTELSGTYVAQSEFGTYLEKTSQEIEEGSHEDRPVL